MAIPLLPRYSSIMPSSVLVDELIVPQKVGGAARVLGVLDEHGRGDVVKFIRVHLCVNLPENVPEDIIIELEVLRELVGTTIQPCRHCICGG